MTQFVKIKTGATFSVPLLVCLPAGAWSATSDIRQAGDALVESLAVSLIALTEPDADGNTHNGLLLATSIQTALWPLGAWRCDVRFADAQTPPVVLYSDQFIVNVEKGTTHG
jgi:hypothetical protein